jgi:hypothetical protein
VYRIIFIICFILFCAITAHAQFRDSTDKAKVVKDSGFVMHKSPITAIILSGVLPGAGQVYTGGWYKAPFIVAGIAVCLYGASVQNTRYHYTADSVNNQLARGDTYNASRYTTAREFYRDDRDKFYIYAALVYMANLLDAYISAHLFDFDVSDPTTSPYISAPISREEPWRMCLRMRF